MTIFKFLFFLYFFCIPFSSWAQTKYDLHLMAARATGIPPIKDQAHLKLLSSKKKLRLVGNGTGYTIARLNYSRPYLTPKAVKVLREIGSRFYIKSKKKTITITSVTRTLQDQKRLTRVNKNAVSTKLSSHNYGCSFDISYIRFNRRKAPNPRLEKFLHSILLQMQQEGKLHFIKEKREACFHITVR